MVALEEILCVPGTVFFLQNGISMPVILKTKQNRKTAFLGGEKKLGAVGGGGYEWGTN